MAKAAVKKLDEVLGRLKEENYQFYFGEASKASEVRKKALISNHSKLIKKLEGLRAYADALPEGGPESSAFQDQLAVVEENAYKYFVNPDIATVDDIVVRLTRDGFTKALRVLDEQVKAKQTAGATASRVGAAPVPPPRRNVAPPEIKVQISDTRSRADQIAISNAIFILEESARLLDSHMGEEGILRLSGSATDANERFSQYNPKQLLTSDSKGPVARPEKFDPNDVVSTLKRIFKPDATISGMAPKADISVQFSKLQTYDDKLAFLIKNLPASHLRMLQIMIQLMQKGVVAQKAAVEQGKLDPKKQLTAATFATATPAVFYTMMGVGTLGSAEEIGQINTFIVGMIQDGQINQKLDAGIKAKNQQGDKSNKPYTSEAQLNPGSPDDDFEMVEGPSRTPSPTGSPDKKSFFASIGKNAGSFLNRNRSASSSAAAAASGAVSPPGTPTHVPTHTFTAVSPRPVSPPVGVPTLASVQKLALAMDQMVKGMEEEIQALKGNALGKAPAEKLTAALKGADSESVAELFSRVTESMADEKPEIQEAGMKLLKATLDRCENTYKSIHGSGENGNAGLNRGGDFASHYKSEPYFEAKNNVLASAEANLQARPRSASSPKQK